MMQKLLLCKRNAIAILLPMALHEEYHTGIPGTPAIAGITLYSGPSKEAAHAASAVYKGPDAHLVRVNGPIIRCDMTNIAETHGHLGVVWNPHHV